MNIIKTKIMNAYRSSNIKLNSSLNNVNYQSTSKSSSNGSVKSSGSKLENSTSISEESGGDDLVDLGRSIVSYEPDLQYNLEELTELVNKLEDMTSVIKQHVRQAKTVCVTEGQFIPQPKPKLPIVIKFILPVVTVLQAFMLIFMSIYDHIPKSGRDQYTIMIYLSVCIFQFGCISLVFCATFILTKQLLEHSASGFLMAQTYVATVLSFTGVYYISHIMNRDGWVMRTKMEQNMAITIYIKMLYLSVSSSTLSGSSNTTPATWYNILVVCVQDILSFVYFASILSQVIGNYQTYTVKVSRNSNESEQNHQQVMSQDVTI